jgi:hypothetical protein
MPIRDSLAETLCNQASEIHEIVGQAIDAPVHAHVVQPQAGITLCHVRKVVVVSLPALTLVT